MPHSFAIRHGRCARAKRDEFLRPQIERVWQANMRVYGADKVWKQMNREGIAAARRTVERPMKQQGLRGASRGKPVRTTVSEVSAPRPLDRVNRQFKAGRTSFGFRISRTFRPGRDGSTWHS